MRDQLCERQGTCPVQRWKASNTAWYLHKLACLAKRPVVQEQKHVTYVHGFMAPGCT